MSYCYAYSKIDRECVDLTEREYLILKVVCAEKEGVSFSSIKRQTSFHQEVLSRALKRLLIYGVIERSEGRYLCPS
ncbi:MAG: hypothetical protein QXR69_01915 [Conexivisphaerales archaeon]